MDIRSQSADWLRTLGYDGDIPEDFGRICNHSTAFIWEQLVQNVRSRVEVQNMRNNIIIHRLNNNGLYSDRMERSQSPLEEISTYLRKKELENDVAKINNSCSEKQAINETLIQQNKIKSFTIEKSNLKIKENEEREYLLRQKLKILEKDVQDAETILNFPTNTNIIDTSDTMNSEDVKEILRNCGIRLEEKVKKLPQPVNSSSDETVSRLMLTVQNTVKKTSTFGKYLCLTEKKTSKKIKEHLKNKENVVPNKVNIRLFSDEGKEKKSLPERRGPKEMSMEENDYENFLVNLNPPKHVHSSVNQTYAEETMFNKTTNVFARQRLTKCIEVVSDEHVAKDILSLLNACNRERIWGIFGMLDDNLHFNVSKKICFRNSHLLNVKNRRQADLANLQSVHVRTELKIIKNNYMLKKLTENLNEKQSKINASIINSGYPSDLVECLKKNLKLQMEDVGLDCVLDVMKKEIHTTENCSESSNIYELKKDLLDIKDKITLKRISLMQYLEIMQDIFSDLNIMHNTTSSCVRKLAAFTSDLNWCSCLRVKVNFREMKVFEEFPYEYNRKFINTDPSLYYRDIHTNKFLCNREINDENMNKLSVIVDNPFTAPETIILNILRTKQMLNALKAIRPVAIRPVETRKNKYSLKYLRDKESYLLNITEQFHSLIASSTSKKTLSASNMSQKVMALWIEMPFSKCIPLHKTVDDKDYKTYEKMFDSFYNNL